MQRQTQLVLNEISGFLRRLFRESRQRYKLLTEWQRYGSNLTGRFTSSKPSYPPCDYATYERLYLAFIAKYGVDPHEKRHSVELVYNRSRKLEDAS